VIDADTIEITGTRIRLNGIDAPESSQLCQRANGTDYRCGQQASLALSDWIGRRTVRCTKTGIDRWQRVLARCAVGGVDMQDWLVRRGHALAYRRYSSDYIAAEAVASAERAGVWQGQFDMPWEWRASRRRTK
jgi:endonuclease YncB( thermonuclease family)